MWKREEAAKPVNPASAATVVGVGGSRAAGQDQKVVNVGKSVVIKGELSGSEDLTIEGQVDGKIELGQHVLTIGPHGRIKAQVFAKAVMVLGEIVGNVRATDKVAIRDSGVVEGDILAPRVSIEEGARFRGKIDMEQGAGRKGKEPPGHGATPQGRARRQPAEAPAPAPSGASVLSDNSV